MDATGFDVGLMADPKFHERIFLIDDAQNRWAQPFGASNARVVEENIWTYVSFGGELPEQGWKIHVSAVPARAEATISIVAGACAESGTDFKYLRSRRMLDVMNGKYAHRASSGKFMAIYPRDAEHSLELLDRLAIELRGFPGPYILSDLSWTDDSPVFTRYGAYREILTPDAETPMPAIRTPDGALVLDRRDVTFFVPDFVEPPERVTARQRELAEHAHVDAPFDVDEVMHFSNGGGVYRATRKSGGTCVVKEARPWTVSHGSGIDAVDRLHHEYEILRRCAGIRAVVTAHALIRLWTHWYLVEEFVDGVTLEEAIVEHRTRLEPDAYNAWAERVYAEIADALDQIHARGIVVGDVHPRNLMFTPDGRVRIIDLEAAFDVDRKRSFIVGAPGFASAEKHGIDVDLHALAALRLRFYNDLPALAALDRGATARSADLAGRMYGADQRLLDEAVTVLGGEPSGDRAVSDTRLRSYIAANATTTRRDLLFPGSANSIAGYRGTNFFDGAAGVLWAWHASGEPVPPEWVAWLVERSWQVRDRRPLGFDGTLGAATALDLIGHPGGRELADYAAARLHHFTGDSFETGRAGALLAFLGFHARSGDGGCAAALERLIERLPVLDPGAEHVTPVQLLVEAGAATFDRARLESGVLVKMFTDLVATREETFGAGRYHELGFLTIAADVIARLLPVEGAYLQTRVRTLARGCRSETRSILHGLGAAALALSGSHEQDDLDAGNAMLDQLHARVVQTPEGNAVPAEGLLRFSCDLSAGSAGLLVVHASIRSSSNRLTQVLGAHSVDHSSSAARGI